MDQAFIDSITEQLEKRIQQKTLVLPMLPQVTSQVLSLVNDVDSDALALTKLIQSDAALAGHVMRIANSAAYSPTAKMTSLQQAIARLGMQNMADIAMAATMGPALFDAKGFEPLIKEIWQSSLATAVWARELARQGRRNVESTFLCGLLFQIGRPVVLQTVLDIANDNDDSPGAGDISFLIDRYQTEVGQVLAEHWQLPLAVSHTIGGVEIDGAAEGSQDIVDTIKAAKVFSACTLSNQYYDIDVLSSDNAVITLNLYVDDVKKLLEKSDSVHETIKELSF
jgi:HD-like signal output (HDOD) protein